MSLAICDVDRNTLESKGKAKGFENAEKFTDYRELLAKYGKKIDICNVSTPDHMHGPITLAAMRLGISCYTQKPLTRTIYEARLLGQVAKETGVCTQMGNQGTALDTSREAIAQIKSGVLGTLKEVFAWSNRPVWAQGPGRRMTLEKFTAQAKKDDPENAGKLIEKKQEEIAKALERVDWKNWLGVAPTARILARHLPHVPASRLVGLRDRCIGRYGVSPVDRTVRVVRIARSDFRGRQIDRT